MEGERSLIVTADDFGIGPATSHGILDLAAEGRVTCTVLLVNSPHAAQAVRAWRQAGGRPELGWHPCLTLDRPVLPAAQVPSLVGDDGRFHRLGDFLRALCLRRVRASEVEAELRAQYRRFIEMVGRPPAVLSSHHHVQVFPLVGAALLDVLDGCRPAPYVRRVREPWSMLARVPGARLKRALLSLLGRSAAREQARRGFPGNDWLAGITDPPFVADAAFLTRWLQRVPGRVVELTCHPGYPDQTLIDRDCAPDDGQLPRRARELELLRQTHFMDACHEARFRLVAPSALLGTPQYGLCHAA